MHVGKTLFAHVMEFVPWTGFARIVQRHGGNSGVRTLSCAEQFGAMAFAQLTWRESLRDIEASLSPNANKLYAMGFLGRWILVLRFSKLLTNHTMSSSKVFHWKRTGCAFISSMPWMMRCFNSSSEATRI